MFVWKKERRREGVKNTVFFSSKSLPPYCLHGDTIQLVPVAWQHCPVSLGRRAAGREHTHTETEFVRFHVSSPRLLNCRALTLSLLSHNWKALQTEIVHVISGVNLLHEGRNYRRWEALDLPHKLFRSRTVADFLCCCLTTAHYCCLQLITLFAVPP